MENQSSNSNQSDTKLNKTTIIIVAVVVGVLILVLAGYFIYRAVADKFTESSIEKMIEAQTGQKVDIEKDGKTMKIESDQGEMEYNVENGDQASFQMEFTDEQGQQERMKIQTDEEGIEVPKELKDSLPIFTPSKMITLNDMGDKGIAGTFVSEKNAEQIKDFYLTEMEKQGWSKIGEFSTNETTSINFEKNSDSANVLLYEKEDQQQFNLSIYHQ